MRILAITSQWPTTKFPERVPFLVREIEAIRRLGVEVDVFNYQGGFKPKAYLRAYRELIGLLKVNEYDLLHAHFGVAGLLPFFLFRYPLVVTFRGSDLNGLHDQQGRMLWSGHLLRLLSQAVAFRANEIIIVSQEMSKHLPKNLYHVIPSGVDLERFKPCPKEIARQKLGLKPDKSYVLFAGGVSNPIKRYSLARDAVLLAREKIRNLELIVANRIAPSQMPMFLSAVDVVLLTSMREGSPNIVKEALACNCRVVSVDVGDVRERIGKLAGCAISKDDTAMSIAESLCQVLHHSEKFEGRNTVSSIDLVTIANRIIDVYKKAKGISNL